MRIAGWRSPGKATQRVLSKFWAYREQVPNKDQKMWEGACKHTRLVSYLHVISGSEIDGAICGEGRVRRYSLAGRRLSLDRALRVFYFPHIQFFPLFHTYG